MGTFTVTVHDGSGQTAMTQGTIAGTGGYNNLANFPGPTNRPQFNASTNTLTWIGPVGGGPSTTNDVQQSRVLTNFSGNFRPTANGQVIQGLNVSGTIDVRDFKNCVVRNCRTVGGVRATMNGRPNTGFVIVEDCLLQGTYSNGSAGIWGGGTWRRNTVSRYENGFADDGPPGGPWLMEDNYIFDLGGGSGGHVDGIEVHGGSCCTNVTMKHNHIEAWNTSCINVSNDYGTTNGVTLDGNRLIKDPNHTAPAYAFYFVLNTGASGTILNARVKNNILQHGYYDNWTRVNIPTGNILEWTNNRDYITNNIIPLGA